MSTKKDLTSKYRLFPLSTTAGDLIHMTWFGTIGTQTHQSFPIYCRVHVECSGKLWGVLQFLEVMVVVHPTMSKDINFEHLRLWTGHTMPPDTTKHSHHLSQHSTQALQCVLMVWCYLEEPVVTCEWAKP